MSITNKQFREKVAEMVRNRELECEVDNHGQLIFYTGFYEHEDGTIHEKEDPTYGAWKED